MGSRALPLSIQNFTGSVGDAGTPLGYNGLGAVCDRLWDVVEAIDLGRATFNKIRQNLFWAFAYNVVGILIAAGVLLPHFHIILSPGTVAALMAMSYQTTLEVVTVLVFSFSVGGRACEDLFSKLILVLSHLLEIIHRRSSHGLHLQSFVFLP